MQDDDDDAEMDDAPTSSASNERANVAAFMLGRQRINDDEDDDAEEAAALAEAAAARKERRKNEKESNRAIYGLVERAEALTRANQLMDAVGLYTEALALDEHNVSLLAARASLTGRLNLHQAVLHDGEMIIRITPDWHQGHAICGAALYCLKQWAPAVRAYKKALDFASEAQGRANLIEALSQAQARADDELRQACLKEDVPELTRLLFGGGGETTPPDGALSTAHSIVSLEAKEPNHGFSALALSTAFGKVQSVQLLLKAGAEVDARDKFGKTPLMWAASMGNEPLATALWKAKADLSAQDRSGWDPLFAACHGGHSRLATVWAATSDVNRATADGTTALMAASQAGHTTVVQLLLNKKARPDAVNAKSQRALELARGGKHAEVISLLQPLTPGAPPPPPPPG